MKKFTRKLSFILLVCVIILAFPACGESEHELIFRVYDGYIQWKYTDSENWSNIISVKDLNSNDELRGFSAYDIAVSQGFDGTEEEWINSLRGQSGESVRIGSNDNWWIGNNDTGVSVYSISSDYNAIPVPSFVGMSPEEIYSTDHGLAISFIGDSEIDTVVVSQSIPSGVLVVKNTQIILHLQSVTDLPSENTSELPSEPLSESPTEKPSQGTDEIPTEKPSESTTEKPTEAPTEQYPIITSQPTELVKGEDATVEILGKPGCEYRIRVYYSDGGSKSDANGLEDKISDEHGCVSWTWRISKSISDDHTLARIKIIDLSNEDIYTTIYIPITE